VNILHEWYTLLTALQKTFLIVGGLGALIFFIQFILMLLGGNSDSDISDSPDIDGHAEGVHADSDLGFKLLSIQSLSTFFMMFGLVGLAFNRGGNYNADISLGAAFAVGSIFMYIVAKMFAFFKTLQNSGTINLRNALKKEARVYLTIKPDEPGQIEVDIQGHLNIYDAVSKESVEIPTGARVKVIEVINNTMVVTKI
jgi:putative flippase GtrA